MTPLYRLATATYHAGIRLAARCGNGKARQWVAGRKEQNIPAKEPGRHRVWMHCASLGEWEQGRPVLEELRAARPEWEFVLTFFSPSGYAQFRSPELVDHVAYLPPDSPANATDWQQQLRPDLAIFVKYEFWFYHLRALHAAGVPTFLVAATFRPDQLFFRAYGGWYRDLLGYFTGILTQTERSRKLLVASAHYPAGRAKVAGDPRLDRTLALTQVPWEDAVLARFSSAAPTIIAGSVWPPDVDVWREAWPASDGNWRIIFAPHQLDDAQIDGLVRDFDAVRYTELSAASELPPNCRVLVLDTIGMLSKSYRYGRVAYVGGAFKTGLHNTLEPLAYGLPTLFGPRHHKFPEAAAAIAAGGAFCITDAEDLTDTLHVLTDEVAWEDAHTAQRSLARANAGAARRTAEMLLQHLSQNAEQ